MSMPMLPPPGPPGLPPSFPGPPGSMSGMPGMSPPGLGGGFAPGMQGALQQSAMQPNDASLQTPFPAPSWQGLATNDQWRQLGIVNPERAIGVTKDDIIDQIQSKKRESEHAREFLDRKWDYLEDSYRCLLRDPDKLDWQADLISPEVYNTIRSFRSLFQSGLFKSRWVRLGSNEKLSPNPIVKTLDKWVRYACEKGGLREEFLNAIEEAMLLGTSCIKINLDSFIRMSPTINKVPLYPPEIEYQMQMQGQATTRSEISYDMQASSTIKWEWKSIRNIWTDPYARNQDELSYTIDEYYEDEAKLEELVKTGVYDSLDDIGEPWGNDRNDSNIRHWDELGMRAGNQYRRRHKIQDCIMDIHDRDGKIVAKNWVVTVINEKAIVRMGPSPYWTGKSPYVFLVPIPYPGRLWGVSSCETEAEIQEEISCLLNLVIDDMKYAVMGAFMVDPDDSREPQGITNIITPGKTYKGKGEFIRKINFQTNSSVAWPLIQQLGAIGDKATRINEFVDGTPTSRGRPSAQEVSTKSSQGTEYVNNLIDSIEDNSLVRCIQRAYEHILQFGDDLTDPNVQEIVQDLGGTEAIISQEQRLELLSHPFAIEVNGTSRLLNRQDTISRLMQLQQMLAQSGMLQANPMVMMELTYALIENIGFDPEQFGLAPDPMSMQQTMMGMQMYGQGPGSSGMPPGNSGVAPGQGTPGATAQAPNPSMDQPPGLPMG